MEFEWDEEKERLNIRKHGLSFSEILPVFLDPKRLEYVDLEHSTWDEERIDVIGRVKDVLFVFCVYTDRENRIRIISARKANKEEIDEYYRDYDAR